MTGPNLTHDELFAASAAEIEAQVRKDAAGLSPTEIELILSLVLRFGPSVYKAILRLFHISPKG